MRIITIIILAKMLEKTSIHGNTKLLIKRCIGDCITIQKERGLAIGSLCLNIIINFPYKFGWKELYDNRHS